MMEDGEVMQGPGYQQRWPVWHMESREQRGKHMARTGKVLEVEASSLKARTG